MSEVTVGGTGLIEGPTLYRDSRDLSRDFCVVSQSQDRELNSGTRKDVFVKRAGMKNFA